MALTLDGDNGISGINGSASTPAVQGTDTNTGLTFGTDTVGVVTGGTTRTTVDSSGRLLVGTSTARSNISVAGAGRNYTPSFQFEYSGSQDNGASYLSYSASNYYPVITLGTSASNTAGTNAVVSNGNDLGVIQFVGNDGTNFATAATIRAYVDGNAGSGDMPGRLLFSTTDDGTTTLKGRMMIYNSGNISMFNDVSDDTLYLKSAEAAGTSRNFISAYYSTSSVSAFGTMSFQVRTNGNVQNTNNSYGGLSDAKLKENIVDANSQWDDLKAIQVRNYNFKEGQTHTQLGVIAQEIELVCPGLVSESPDRENVQIPILDENGDAVLDENGDPTFTFEERETGEVTKTVNYSVLYMKAVKALQEAMERIEQLETRLTALEGGAA